MLSSQQLTHRLNEALAHHKAGRLDRAEAIYRQLAAAAPKVALVFDLWGQLADVQGRTEDAAKYYLQAYRIDGRSFPVLVRLAQALVSLGRPRDAETFLRRYLETSPSNFEAWNALGFILKLQNRVIEALACHEKAVTLNPKFVEGWVHYGLTLGVIGEGAKALQRYERALELDPKNAAARYGRAETLQKVYRHEEALAEYETYLKLVPDNFEARSYRLFALQNDENITREQLFAEHVAYGNLVGRGPTVLPDYDYSPDKRLRVAILSPDLRTHSCAYFLEPLLKHLDGAQFEVYLYHDHFREDEMSQRLKKYGAVWRNFVGQSLPVVERAIRRDKPDILVDLSGHIGVSIRLPILAKRLAPVQITYLGYPDTTGVPAMDYRLTDPTVDPPGEADAFATEKLIRFSSVAWAYQPPHDAPDVAPLPCLTNGYVTFGCFNSPTKFTDALYRAWAQVLERVANSRLLLKGRDFESADIRAVLLGRMQRCGVPIDRLDLVPRNETTAEHLAQYGRIDLALDTFPYNGTTTTCEAMWMGRPVITLRGGRHAARVGSSLLAQVGRSDWIAQSTEEYVRIATALASAPEAMRAHAAELRPRMSASTMLDHPQQSRRFAETLRNCWRERCTEVTAARTQAA